MRADFVPAQSLAEAGSRIFALSGQRPGTTRGPKRALVALARSLGLDVDLEATNAVLGREIADALALGWPPGGGTRTGQITLRGMNWLLAGASEAFASGSAQRVEEEKPVQLADWSGFRPARSKLEAVNRIAALTRSGPQDLGPGGKERKSVFVNLAQALFPQIDTSVSKTNLGARLAAAFGLTWPDNAASTGYTITLDGLNIVLAGAERHLERLGLSPGATFATAAEEGSALVAVLRERLPQYWDGRACVREMRQDEYAHWRQSEWPGWYAEFKGFPALNDTFRMPETGGPLRKFGNTVFDYSFGWVWDLKAHTVVKEHRPSGRVQRGGSTIILNDAEAALECIARQGLGFLVLNGKSLFDDDGAFDDWHRAYTRSERSSSTRSNSGRRRPRKSAFDLQRVDAYWIPNLEAFDAAVAGGRLAIRAQGRQQARGDETSGAPRRDKLQLTTTRADGLRIGSAHWTAPA